MHTDRDTRSSDVDDDAKRGKNEGQSWLPSANPAEENSSTPDDILAAALAGRPMTTARIGGPGIISTSEAAPDWLAEALSGEKKSRGANQLVSALATKRPSRKQSSGGGWLMSGALMLSTDGSKDQDIAKDVKKTKGTTDRRHRDDKDAGEAAAPGVTPDVRGGWLTLAATSGHFGVPGADDSEGDHSSDCEVEDVGITVETQTDENIGEAGKSATSSTAGKSTGKLPPWAKPWTPPPLLDNERPLVVAEAPHETTAAPAAASIEWINGTVNKSPTQGVMVHHCALIVLQLH